MIAFREAGYERQLKEQQAQLEHFRTKFDVWFSERSLTEQDGVGHAIEKLREQGHLYDADDALWMRTTDFTDDKDRVLIRSNGEPTYFASDAAYYVNKRERGFDVCIYLLGADHHGYVNRLKAIAACAGDDPEHNIEVLIGQLVKILKGRRGDAAVQAGRHHRHARRAGRGGRRRPAPLHAGPLPGRLPADAGHRGDDPAGQRQPGLLRPVRARPARLDPAQRGRARASSWTSSTPACSATSARATCSGRSPSSRAWSPPRPSCASRTGSPGTWRTPRRRSTSSTTAAGCCRGATRRSSRCTRLA